MNKVLCCDQLCKAFSENSSQLQVLKGVNLAVGAAEMIAIVGTSGAGKSTLLQLLGGLDKPTSGTVWVSDQNMTLLKETAKDQLRNQALGFVYQFHHLLPEFSALENVCMPLLIRRLNVKQVIQKAREMMALVGLENRSNHRIGELSGGERQRVAIARALVTEPRCVLADEPTGNLDEATAQQVYELILNLNQQLQTSFVIVTHNKDLAARLHRTLILEQGLLNPI